MPADTTTDVVLAVSLQKDGIYDLRYIPIKTELTGKEEWDFFTTAIAIDSTMRAADELKIYLFNPSEKPMEIAGFDVSFRPLLLPAREKTTWQ